MTLVFVCSGNTCRSPLACAAWRSVVPEVGAQLGAAAWKTLEEVEVVSVGLCAQSGARATRHALAVAAEWGIDLSAHRARRVATQVLREARWVAVMTAEQGAQVRGQYGVPPAQLLLLGALAPVTAPQELALFHPGWTPNPELDEGDGNDILDPFGGSLEGYQACAAHIRRSVHQLALRVAGGTL